MSKEAIGTVWQLWRCMQDRNRIGDRAVPIYATSSYVFKVRACRKPFALRIRQYFRG
jgi:hypothetical protein